jgi:hypothetical protein
MMEGLYEGWIIGWLPNRDAAKAKAKADKLAERRRQRGHAAMITGWSLNQFD